MKKFEMLNIIAKDCELTAKEKLVAQYFVYKSNKAGACYPCVDKIAEQCSVSRRTVQRATKKLCEKGYILIEKRFKFGKQTSNLYSFNILLLEEIERIQEEEKTEDKAIEPEMEVIDFEELLFQEQEVDQDNQMVQNKTVEPEMEVIDFDEIRIHETDARHGHEFEEIDLDDLVADSVNDDYVWEEVYDNPFEDIQDVEKQRIHSESEVEQLNNIDKLEMQTANQESICVSVTINVLNYVIKCCEMEGEQYSGFMLNSIESEKEELQLESSNEASNNIMGAFFPP